MHDVSFGVLRLFHVGEVCSENRPAHTLRWAIPLPCAARETLLFLPFFLGSLVHLRESMD